MTSIMAESVIQKSMSRDRGFLTPKITVKFQWDDPIRGAKYMQVAFAVFNLYLVVFQQQFKVGYSHYRMLLFNANVKSL